MDEIVLKKTARTNVEPPRRRGGILCPSCSNVPRELILFYFVPTFFTYHCRVCNALLRGNRTVFIIDLLSYVGAGALFLLLRPLSVFVQSFIGIDTPAIFAVFSYFAVRTPALLLQIKAGHYIRLYE